MNDHFFSPARFWAASVAVFIFCFLLAAPVRAQVLYTLDLGFDFHSGDYGSGITTEVSTSYVTLGFYPGQRFDVRLTLPWLYQSNNATTSSGGVRFGTPGEQLGGTGSGGEGGGSGPMLRRSLDALNEEESVVVAERSRSGLGDMTLVAGYAALLETEYLPLLRPTVMVKFPTASDDLGTGEYDLGMGIEMSKWLHGWYLFGSGSAVFQGGKEALGLKDFTTYEGGAGYRIAGLLPFLSLWGASSPAETSSSLLEARFDLSYRWSDNKGLSVKAMRGLSDSSPDYGFGGALFVVF